MQLDEALAQISQIRQRMAESQVFRGYRSGTTAFTALVAVVAAAAQARLVPQPEQQLNAYLALWCGAAFLGAAVVGLDIAVRCARSGSPLQRQFPLVVVDQFAPALDAGALLTLVVASFAPPAPWMLTVMG